MQNNIKDIGSEILIQATKSNFAGQDPFDGLNSKLFDVFPKLKKGLLGLAWIQFHKRSAINFRPLCGVPQKRNPKGIALFILGLLEDYKQTDDTAFLQQAIELADWLLTQTSEQKVWKHACWGYHFDWNARAFFVPKGKPNVITTIYVAQALLALWQVTQQERFKDPAVDSADFIVKTLYTEHDGRKFFAYIPGEQAFVHNANLWAAAWVAKVASITGNEQFKELALTATRQSVNEQRLDGSWVYGSRHHHQFIDGFHTGYNLEALTLVAESLQTEEFDSSIKRGFTYYVENFFEEDGTAKYYNTNKYPLDMHSVSQAVFTLIKVGGTATDFALADKVIKRAIDLMYLPKKSSFVYQINKRFTNKLDYIRWTQAWVYYSFAFYNRATIQQINDQGKN